MTCDSCGHKSIKAGEQAGAPAVDAHRAGNTGHGDRCPTCGQFVSPGGHNCPAKSNQPVGYYRPVIGPGEYGAGQNVYAVREIDPANFNPMAQGLILQRLPPEKYIQAYVNVVGGREWINISRQQYTPKPAIDAGGFGTDLQGIAAEKAAGTLVENWMQDIDTSKGRIARGKGDSVTEAYERVLRIEQPASPGEDD